MRYPNVAMIGAAPGRHPRHDPERHALFPVPERSTGHRLYEMTGLEMMQYISIYRRNVIAKYPGSTASGDRFPIKLARAGAERLLPELYDTNALLVGAGTAKAFGFKDYDPLVWNEGETFRWAVLPHPSGRNRWYNEGDNRAKAATFMKRFGDQVRLRSPVFV